MRRSLLLLVFLFTADLHADFRAGVAQIDITPDYPVRLHGFGGRRAESEGIWQRITASALAIDDGSPAVIISVDNLGVPAKITALVARDLNLPLERLTICATHTHTAPMLSGVAPTIFGTAIPPEHQQRIDRYSREFTDRLVAVGKAALADRKSARLSWGVGSVGFAINRRSKGGPVDHDLPLLAIHGNDGKLRAVVVGYACHCVTLADNKIGGDWAAVAREAIQAAHPGAIALVTIGCGADQNPDTRGQGENKEPAIVQGRAIAGEVRRMLGQFLAPVRGPIATKLRTVELPFADPPARSEWDERAKRPDAVGHHAKVQLARLDRGEPLAAKIDYGIRTWTFGDDLAMVFLPGEVVVDYGLRLKKELDGRRLWITAYANDSPCYIPSERVLKEGGYEGGDAMVYYDQPGPLKLGLEDKIVTAVRESIGPRFVASFDPAKVQTVPPSPQQACKKLLVGPGITVELVAAEPQIQSPVAIAFGADGRMWVAEMSDYPAGARGDYKPGGRVSVLTDRDDAGRYRKSSVYLDNIPFPTGVTAWRNGVLVCAAPDILYAEDTDGDGRADVVKKLYSGFGTENFQARVNSLEYGLDGWVYGSCGLYGGTITSFSGIVCQLGNRDFRIKPDVGAIEPAAGRTQQGRVRNDWGDWFGCDNSNLAWHYPLPDHYLRRNPHAAPISTIQNLTNGDQNRVFPASQNLQLFKLSGAAGRPTSACGIGVYRDDLFGNDWQGNLFTCESVNLLVHRMVLTPSGSAFTARRAADEESRAFLASTDPWFRPVQMRTGPDGCIYIVDMSRYVIEHPRWIPESELSKVDVRAGSNLGRIYRVRPSDKPARPVPRLDKMSGPELAQVMEMPNGTLRDLASQMLAWRSDRSAVPVLEKLAVGEYGETRIQALSTLEALGALRLQHVRRALSDVYWPVRREGVRLAERFIAELGPILIRMVDDPDPHVHLQLAFTLGEWRDERGGTVLAQIARSDQFLVAAAMSGLNDKNLNAFLYHVVKPNDLPSIRMMRDALGMAAAREDHASINTALYRTWAFANLGWGSKEFRWHVLGAALEALSRVNRPIESVLDDRNQMFLKLNPAARSHAAAEVETITVRLAAMSVLGWHKPSWPDDLKFLPTMLKAKHPPEIQLAAADALARIGDPVVSKLLLAAWNDAAPTLKARILDLLLARRDGIVTVLDASETNAALAGSIDASRRQALLTNGDAKLRERATRLFGNANSDRAQALREYRDALTLPGDAERGKAIYANRCATCHRFGETGHAVGPDLHSLTNKSPEYLLQEILDPNRALDSRYVEYTAVTKNGKVFRGLLAEESAASVTLKSGDAKTEVVLRNDIESLTSTGRSLMPEGMEKDLSRQALADVMTYIFSRPAQPPGD